MNFTKWISAVAIALAGLLAVAGAASAYEATATTSLNVRSGPGTSFRPVGVLQPNQIVNVLECNAAGSWCRVQDRTIAGWASARYLRPLTASTPSRPVPTPAPAPGQPSIGFSINTPNFSVSIGSGGQRPGTGRICFYEDYDYSGRNFCVRDGDQDRRLSSFWNNRIRSARVEGNVSATVCTGANYAGRCGVVDRSVRNLGMLANNVSSFYVGRR